MELAKEMLAAILRSEEIKIEFPQLKASLSELVETESYAALSMIKCILEDRDLSDEDCFLRIEEIVKVFEGLGSNCGGRHDFG